MEEEGASSSAAAVLSAAASPDSHLRREAAEALGNPSFRAMICVCFPLLLVSLVFFVFFLFLLTYFPSSFS